MSPHKIRKTIFDADLATQIGLKEAIMFSIVCLQIKITAKHRNYESNGHGYYYARITPDFIADRDGYFTEEEIPHLVLALKNRKLVHILPNHDGNEIDSAGRMNVYILRPDLIEKYEIPQPSNNNRSVPTQVGYHETR